MRILLIFFIFIHFFINALTWDYYTISATDKNSSTPQISFNDDNEGFAIYAYNSQILVSKYDTTFESPSVISGALTTLSSPQISRNTSDEAAAVWLGPGYIYQSTFDSSEWSDPASISQHTGFDTYTPSSAGVSMNDDGDAIAVWGFYGMSFPFPEKYAIQFSKFISPNWSSYSNIISSDFIIYREPRVKYNDFEPSYGMVVFWDDYNIKASYYNGSSWSTPELISDGGVISDTANIAFDNSNRAVAVWTAYNAPTYYIKAATYDGSDWSSVETLFSSTSHVGENPQVSMNNSGNALVIFSSDSDDKIRGCKYSSGTWSHTGASAYTLSASGIDYLDDNVCSVSISSTNEGIAVWKRNSLAVNLIEASMFNWATDSWDSTEDVQIISDSNYASRNPRVEINSSDISVAVFEQYNGSVYYIRGAVSSDPPPI